MGEVITIPRIIPLITDYQQAFNARIRAYLEKLTGFPVTDSNIFQLVMEHHGAVNVSRMTVQIGMRSLTSEPIIAIFAINGWFQVCTKSMGALAGSPKYISGKDVVEIVKYRDTRQDSCRLSVTSVQHSVPSVPQVYPGH